MFFSTTLPFHAANILNNVQTYEYIDENGYIHTYFDTFGNPLSIQSVDKMYNPDIESENLLALTYFGLEEYKSANNIFINLLSKNSDNISLLLNSAKCYDKLGENDKALEKLYKLTEIFPEHEEAQEMIRRLS